VTGNTVSANDVNIFAGADSGATSGQWTISNNTVTGATDNVPNTANSNDDGIYIDSASGSNTVSGNIAKKNVRYDYEDASTGAPPPTPPTPGRTTPASRRSTAPEGLWLSCRSPHAFE
jgi:parallel beta-helix repeat protein